MPSASRFEEIDGPSFVSDQPPWRPWQPSPVFRQRLALALLLAGCAPTASEPLRSPSPPPQPPSAPTPPPAPAPLPSAEPSPPSPPSPLARFFAAARALDEGSRAEPLRIAVFGDSHIQADHLTGRARKLLQERLGDAGLGFVHLGWRGYRHDGVRFERRGPFRTEPRPMSSSKPRGDGIYGLSGVRVVAEASSFARLSFATTPAPLLDVDLAYRLPTCPARVRIVASHGKGAARQEEVRTLACQEAEEPGPIEHLELTVSGENPALSLEVQEGQIEVFGLVVEAPSPGVVLDALGISGARAQTPLAWNREAFVDEVRRRDYDLVVLAYGTNDSVPASPSAVPAFGEHLHDLLDRLREAASQADCLVLGPMDRGEITRPDTAPASRIVELNEEAARVAEEAGCGFASLLDWMGGPGSIDVWANETPPLAQPDRIHLTQGGYDRLGERLAEALLEGLETPTSPGTAR